MGSSWSNNRRRNNNYLHHPPPQPHHQLVPYTSQQLSLPAPPQPPLNPYPHPQQESYPSTSYYAPPPLPQQLPANYSSYYYSHGYNSCNYNNPTTYPPFYANQINGQWPLPSPMPQSQHPQPSPVISAPYVEHQKAKKVRNDVNIHKDTLRIEIDERNPDEHLVSFVFDALFDGSITLYYFGKEESECKFAPLFPEIYMPLKISFQKGLGQKFQQPSRTGIDLGFFELDDISKASPQEDVFPLVIVAEAHSSLINLSDSDDPVPNMSSNMQITQAVLEKNNGGSFQVRVIKQILWIDEVRYEMREIYGIGTSTKPDINDDDAGEECVICMTNSKDTAILPCRHMCMCSECAKELRLQSDKCPICRQPIEELLEIKINDRDQ